MEALAKIVGLAIAGVIFAVVVAGTAVYLVSEMRLNQKADAPAESPRVPTDIASIQYGQHLAGAVARCLDCHGPNLAGKVLTDNQSARIVAPNLTRGIGGVGATFSDADFVRAIRQGVDPSGRLLLVMPSDDYSRLGDGDLAMIIAYIRSVPPINNTLPPSEVRAVGRVLLASGQLPLLPAASIGRDMPRPPTPRPGVTQEYGAYLAEIAGCLRCHGPGLSGGTLSGAMPGAVAAANITPTGIGDWSDADFLRAMRTGRRPDGRALESGMPWPYYAQMSELELRAIWRFLQTVPPRQTGSR